MYQVKTTDVVYFLVSLDHETKRKCEVNNKKYHFEEVIA